MSALWTVEVVDGKYFLVCDGSRVMEMISANMVVTDRKMKTLSEIIASLLTQEDET